VTLRHLDPTISLIEPRQKSIHKIYITAITALS
jgi:hypothetical protein